MINVWCLAEKSVVYYCKVTRLDNNTCEYYTGLTEGAFKYRLYGHNSSFKSHKQKNSTKLSKHIWWLKSNNIAYQLEWKILGKANIYNPVTRVCRLCLLEKYFIMYKPETATLNSIKFSTHAGISGSICSQIPEDQNQVESYYF